MLRPLGDRVLIEPVEAPKISDGGIHIARKYEDPETMGTVIAIGDGPRTAKGILLPHVCTVGDMVAFASTSGQEVWVDGKLYLTLKEGDVLALVTT